MTPLRGAQSAILALISACATAPPAPEARVEPAILGDRLRAVDGTLLGLSVSRAENPKAVVVAVHGMNDYARTFKAAAAYWAQAERITVYAYDQRGFGRSPGFGRWPGVAALKADLRAAVAAAKAENPGIPLIVVGHSMGAGVVMAAAKDAPLPADGVILAAPGVWGGARMSFPARVLLRMSATLLPGKTLTGERAKRQATDNIQVLRMMQRDPLVIKATRLDAVRGVVRLMGEAWDASNEIGGRSLVLFGEKDQIIPRGALGAVPTRLCGVVETRVYPEGWHMLFDDLQAEQVWRDVAQWIRATPDGAGFGPAASACPPLLGRARGGERRSSAVERGATDQNRSLQ